MSLSALATVEQQLIMQCLPSREIVQLALCSRSLMHAADSPFAFRHAEHIRRPFPEPPEGSSVVRPARLCLRHAPFIVVWTLPSTDLEAELETAVDALIAFLAATPVGQLHGLDAEDNTAWISEAQWKRVLACPAVHQIRYLAFPRPRSGRLAVSAEVIALLRHLPLLSTLRGAIDPNRRDPNAPKAPRDACVLFCRSRREELEQQQPDLSFGRLGAKLGELWLHMTPADKQPFEDQATLDRDRYQRDMLAYTLGRGQYANAGKPPPEQRAQAGAPA